MSSMRLSAASVLLAGGLTAWTLATPAGLSADDAAVAEVPGAAPRRSARELVTFLDHRGFYALRDPDAKDAIVELRAVPQEAAALLTELLDRGLRERDRGWIEVYRPLFLLKQVGPHAKAALPGIVKALDDGHSANVGAAAEVLAGIGPEARDAGPALEKAWSKASKGSDYQKNWLRKALKAVDPEAARRAGVE